MKTVTSQSPNLPLPDDAPPGVMTPFGNDGSSSSSEEQQQDYRYHHYQQQQEQEQQQEQQQQQQQKGHVITRTRRKAIPRKGHTKSRKGCLTCKKRKVKCPEDSPQCLHCRRIGLPCEWPDTATTIISGGGRAQGKSLSRRTKTSPPVAPSIPLQSTPTMFSMQDLQYFQHFLFQAYPRLPMGGEAIWRDVAAMSHNYDFLIHAMMGIAASHLSLYDGQDHTSQALTHRVKAISSLNSALSNTTESAAKNKALFAAAFILVFQSSFMPDGMYDFIAMLRGCYLVATTVGMPANSTEFELPTDNQAVAVWLDNGGTASRVPLEQSLVSGFLSSMDRIAPLCKTTAQKKYHAAIENAIKGPETSSAVDVFTELSRLYTIFGNTTPSEYRLFSDASNPVGQLLLAHFFLIEAIIQVSCYRPATEVTPHRKNVTAAWVRGVLVDLPTEYDEYARWSLDFADMVASDDIWSVSNRTEMDLPDKWKLKLAGSGDIGTETELVQQVVEPDTIWKYFDSESATDSNSVYEVFE